MEKISRNILFILLSIVSIIHSSDIVPLSPKIYTERFKIKLERVYDSQALMHKKLAQERDKLRLQKEIEASRAENEPWENAEFIDEHNSREQFKAGLERVYELKTRFAQELIWANQRRVEDHEKLQQNKQMAVLSYNQGTGLGKALKLIYLHTKPKPLLTVPEVDSKNLEELQQTGEVIVLPYDEVIDFADVFRQMRDAFIRTYNIKVLAFPYHRIINFGKAFRLMGESLDHNYFPKKPRTALIAQDFVHKRLAYDMAEHGQEKFEVQKRMTDAETLYLTYSESLLVAIKEYRALSPYEKTLSFTNDQTQQRLEITSELSPWFTDDYKYAGPIMRALISSKIHARLFDAHGKVIVNKEYGGTHQSGLNSQTQDLFDLLGEDVLWRCQFCLNRKTLGLTDGVVKLIPEFFEGIVQRDLGDK